MSRMVGHKGVSEDDRNLRFKKSVIAHVSADITAAYL